MPIIFVKVKEEVNFFLGLVRGGAKSVGTAEFAFESGYYGLGVLARLKNSDFSQLISSFTKDKSCMWLGRGSAKK